MNFDLTTEQDDLRQAVREFAETEIKPHVRKWDEEQQVPKELTQKLGQLGVFGTVFPEPLGGAGMGHVDQAIAIEELARVDPSVALIVAAHTSLCASHIYLRGSEEQRQRYIPKLAGGEWLVLTIINNRMYETMRHGKNSHAYQTQYWGTPDVGGLGTRAQERAPCGGQSPDHFVGGARDVEPGDRRPVGHAGRTSVEVAYALRWPTTGRSGG